MQTYPPFLAVDEIENRPMSNMLAEVVDAETSTPVQIYRDGAPLAALVTGPNGVVTTFQTDNTTRRVGVRVGSVSMVFTSLESIAEAAAAGARVDGVEAGMASLQDAMRAIDARQDAIEAAAEFGPSTPTDGTMASHILRPGTLTRAAVVGQVEDTVRFAAGGEFVAPYIADEIELLRDPDGRLEDGAAWLTMVNVEGRAGTWLDKWYGYVSGHDSKAVWLVTAPSPLGPWTYREAVVGIPGSGAKVEEPLLQAHTSSPYATWHGDELRLYYHGPKASNIYEQPTVMATSTNGRDFTRKGFVLDTEWGNYGSPYRTSVSYVTAARHDGLYHAIWQGTTGKSTIVDGTPYVSFPVGYATSMDGVKWIKRPPIIASHNGDQGLAAPGLIRLPNGWMVVGTYRSSNGSGGQSLAIGCYYGPTLDRLRRVGDIPLPGGRMQELATPTFAVHEGRLWMIGGCRPPGSNARTVTAFALDWRN